MGQYISESEEQTIQIAKQICEFVIKKHNQDVPLLIGLEGPLGAGKSVLARQLIRSFCDDDTLPVPSPTFTLLQTYEAQGTTLYHYDLYRLTTAEDIWELGWEESLSSGITLVEWPSRLEELTPSNMLFITFSIHDNQSRIIELGAS